MNLSRVDIPIVADGGVEQGRLWIATLGSTDADGIPLLLNRQGEPGRDPATEAIQLLEGKEYRFWVEDVRDGVLSFDRGEMFSADDESGRQGRLRTGLYTGSVPVTCSADGAVLGRFAFEVRSRKFDYLHHYRWMLGDLADVMSEVVMNRFGTAEQRFSIDDTRDASTLYQRFALLQSLLQQDALLGSLRHVMARPFIKWKSRRETQSVRKGLRGSSSAARQLTRPGARVAWPEGRLATIPRHVESEETYSTVDNPPNQFVKFALGRWRTVVAQIRGALLREENPSSVQSRGVRETQAVLDVLDDLLSSPFFRSVGRLDLFPTSNQVLQKRAGYRFIYRTFLQFELAAKISWDGLDDHKAGQRDVATLFEYWVFIKLVELVAQLCDSGVDLESMFEVDSDGLVFRLKQGKTRRFRGQCTRDGRVLDVTVYYNRSFTLGRGSWTRQMRPDVSLQIIPRDSREHEVWVHFDAKYRLDQIERVFTDEDEVREIEGSAKNEDLKKMHTYRDAIRRTAGAYVIYPGDRVDAMKQYNEILPGLGAFPLCPTSDAEPSGAATLRRFISDIMEHVSNQSSQHERGRFWTRESFGGSNAADSSFPLAAFLKRPPADTRVLLGFVKSQEHFEWVRQNGMYNLRADPNRRGAVGVRSKELAADFVVLYAKHRDQGVLYRVVGEPSVRGRSSLEESGYPSPRGEAYFLLRLEPVSDLGSWAGLLSWEGVSAAARELSPDKWSAPVATSWDRLAAFLLSRHSS